jgi:hypothetical protein
MRLKLLSPISSRDDCFVLLVLFSLKKQSCMCASFNTKLLVDDGMIGVGRRSGITCGDIESERDTMREAGSSSQSP